MPYYPGEYSHEYNSQNIRHRNVIFKCKYEVAEEFFSLHGVISPSRALSWSAINYTSRARLISDETRKNIIVSCVQL